MARQRHFDDAETAFRRGDFSEAHRLSSNTPLGGAALVMLGAFESGEILLADAVDPRSLFCRALLAWGRGEAANALSLLEKITAISAFSPAAERLGAIIARGKVRVLLQGRDDPSLPDYDVAGTMKDIDFADIVTVGYPSRSDIPIEDTATLNDVLSKLPSGWSPDFYLCSMIEDHPPPLGIENAVFPTLYSTQDYDRHFQHCRPLMSLFDVGIAFSSVFHEELEHLTGGGRAFVCPMLMGLNAAAPMPDEIDKSVDLYISGNLFNHSEGKTRNLWRISQLPDRFRIVLQNSHLSTSQYLRRLRDSKFTFGYVSNWGVINSRVIEALAQGCGGFYQRGGELGLFLGEDNGAVPYTEDDLEAVISAALDEWTSRHKETVRAGITRSREVFDFRRVMRRHLLLATAYAVLSGVQSRVRCEPELSQWRYPNRSAIRVMYCHDGDPDRLLARQVNFRAHLAGQDSYEARDAVGESYLYTHLFKRTVTQKLLDDQVRMAQAAGPLAARNADVYRNYTDHHRSAELELALATYRALSADYPDRMAATYNEARLSYELGAREAAVKLFLDIVDGQQHYVPTDLLFWREFHDRSFDYERFMWALENHALTNDAHYLRKIETYIRESALYYLCTFEDDAAINVARCYLRSGIHQLHALNFETFRLLARVGRTEDAEEYLRRLYDMTPWFMAKFGEDVIRVMAEHGIDNPSITAAWQRFRKRLS